jgi:membrane fusion protein (multidrug efflux system)
LDNAIATQRTAVAQLQAAQAELHQSQINLGYTEISAPIDGRIGRTSVTIGNVVNPTSGVLATIVSDDPMYVVFPVSVRRALELRDRYADKGGFDAVRIRLRLSTGKIYDQIGKLDFVDIGVAKDTDTIVFRGTISNPLMPTGTALRELADGQFVAVLLEAVEPLKVLAVPRAALLTDQQGQYVYVVNDKNIAEQRRVTLGQSTAEIAAVTDGLKQGDRVVTEGLQRVRPNQPVAPAPAPPTRPEAMR